MNGAHDMGGTHGFGPVVTEENEPVFHEPWEGRVLAMTLAAGSHRRWNLDQTRFARENVAPDLYLARSYYEIWLEGLETLLVNGGLVTADEIEAARRGERFEREMDPPFTADMVAPAIAAGNSARRDVDVEPRFAEGDAVEVRPSAPHAHTRAPRYVRGRPGAIDRDHGVFVFPDTHAATGDAKPQHLYSVRFEATDLWGADAQGGAVYVDLWDDHLEPGSRRHA